MEIQGDAPTVHPPPAWCGDISIRVQAQPGTQLPSGESVEAEAASIEGTFDGLTIWQRGWQALYPTLITSIGGLIVVRVPFQPEILRAIEEKRSGNGPVRLELDVVLRYRRIRQEKNAATASRIVGPSETCTSRLVWHIQRDPWHSCLARLGWSEITLFELRMARIRALPDLSYAVDCLRSAERFLHFGGDPKVVLAKCNEALESAAKHNTMAGNVKAGFAFLLERAFPDESDKAILVDRMIRTIREFGQFGRHSDHKKRHVSWHEARFALVCTLGLFDLLTNNGS